MSYSRPGRNAKVTRVFHVKNPMVSADGGPPLE
jgi:hypothetical protein